MSKPKTSRKVKWVERIKVELIGKEDVQLIYNPLSAYKPTEREEILHSTLLEWFEKILVVDYGEPYQDAN